MEGTNEWKRTKVVHLGLSGKSNNEHTIIEDVNLMNNINDDQEENSTDARMKKYMKTVQCMNIEIGDLKKELEKEKKEYGELKRSLEITQKEEKRLKELNHEFQQTCINSCHEFKGNAIDTRKGFSNRDITILSMNKTQKYLRY